MLNGKGDRAFNADSIKGSNPELVFAGATSFMRRTYTRETTGVDIVVSGVPYDLGTTFRSIFLAGPLPMWKHTPMRCWPMAYGCSP